MGVMVVVGGIILFCVYELVVWGFGVKVVGGVFSVILFVGGIGGFVGEIGGMFIMIVFVGFGVGVIFYFLLFIFLFMYFFFVVIGWIMEIFEVIVVMLFWVFVYLCIDGDGMLGFVVINGYYLLFVIFLRLVLIIFGLIVSFLIFFVVIFVFQIFFMLFIEVMCEDGLFGFEIMFFMVIFLYMLYMIGLSCFKFVDIILN